MTVKILDLLVRTNPDGPHGTACVVLEDGSRRSISAASSGRAFEAACTILANTRVSIPLWDETAEKLARLCARVVGMHRDLVRAEAGLTKALTEHPSVPATVRRAAHTLFETTAASFEALEAARTVLAEVQASPEADTYAKSPISVVIEDSVRRLACVVGIVALRGLVGIVVEPVADGAKITLPPSGAPLKDPQWAARVAKTWIANVDLAAEWWLDFWPAMREMQDHPGLTVDERESLSRVVAAHTSQAVH